MSDPTTLILHALFPLDRTAATQQAGTSHAAVEGSPPTAAPRLQGLPFNLDALKSDAGAMYDVLGMIVDFMDQGRVHDTIIRHNGERVWLIDELARAIVDRHNV